MRRNVLWTGGVLIALGLAIFAWKTVLLDLPVIPSDPEGLWRVELEVNTRGSGGRGSVVAAIPSTGAGQVVSDENVLSDRMLFTIREDDDQRLGVWSGVLDGIHTMTIAFRVRLTERSVPLPSPGRLTTEPGRLEGFGGVTAVFPADAPEIAEVLASLDLPPPEEGAVRLRTLFGYVADEIALVEGESDDALLALIAREGSAEGKARLLVTLIRASGEASRVVYGLELTEGSDPRPEVWVEAAVGEFWLPMSPSSGFFATRPPNLLALRRGDPELVRGTGLAALSHQYRSLRQRLSSEELAAMMQPANPVLAQLSLYRLPVEIQQALRLLLLVPLGALAMALLRNVVGIPTFGTFLPVLVALALRGSDLLPGLFMLLSVIVIGVLSRLLLERLHLLLVPRLCIILCAVILVVTLFAVLGRGFENRNLFGGVVLPIVILAMLIERFSISAAEEGLPQACVLLGWTGAVAMCIYPVFRSEQAEAVLFGFPELVISVMGLLVLVGGYTGYRVLEIVRFRAFSRAHAGNIP